MAFGNAMTFYRRVFQKDGTSLNDYSCVTVAWQRDIQENHAQELACVEKTDALKCTTSYYTAVKISRIIREILPILLIETTTEVMNHTSQPVPQRSMFPARRGRN